MAPAAVVDEFRVSGQQTGTCGSGGSHDDTVGGIAVKGRGEAAAVESNLRRERQQGEARRGQSVFDPLAARRCQADAALGFEHSQFPHGDDGEQQVPLGGGAFDGF